jgi:hypothetical protein
MCPPANSAPVTGINNPGSTFVSVPDIRGVDPEPGLEGVVVGGTGVAVGSIGSSGVEVEVFVAVGSPGSPGSSGVEVGVFVAVGSGVLV